jgi:hypothetical protein
MNLPDGQITQKSVKPLWQEYSDFQKSQISLYPPYPAPLRGAFRERHGRRGGMRRTQRRARRAMLLRTAKSCGPDISTLVSSLRSFPQATVAKEPDRRGEREVSRKTIARGMPGVSGVTVVTTVHFLPRAHRRPAFPAPSDRRGREIDGKPRVLRAARLNVFLAVVARSAATKQSSFLVHLAKNWIASLRSQ